MLSQQRDILLQFATEHNSKDLVVVRSDNLHSNGDNSIRESVTNLIAAQFFISKGFLVLEDTGSGPDLIALKTGLLNDLKERRFIGIGACLSQLATIRILGKVNESSKEVISEDEVIAVESESVNPRRGIRQLKGGYNSGKFNYMGFFDRRILAAPFLDQGGADFDVLTYDINGLQYRMCKKFQAAPAFWRSKKKAFLDEVISSIKSMLLLNLTFEETATMISNRPEPASRILHEIPKLQMEKILDKIESVLP